MLTPADFNLPAKFQSWREHQLFSIMKITSSQSYCFLLDAPTGSGKCTEKGTLIWKPNGVTRIEDVDSDEVISIGSIGFGEPQLAKPSVCLGMQPAARVVTQAGYELSGALDHNLLVLGGDKLSWSSLGNISPGTEVPIYIGGTDGAQILLNMPDNVSQDDIAYFLGLWTAEGSYNGTQVVVAATDDGILKWLWNFASKVNIEIKAIRGGVAFCYSNLGDMMRAKGFQSGSRNKHVPMCVFNTPRSNRWAFLSGYTDGDGSTDGEIVTISVSRQLSKDIQMLYLSLGVVSVFSHRICRCTNSKNPKDVDAWKVNVGSCSYDDLHLVLLCGSKVNKLRELLSKKRNPNIGAFSGVPNLFKREMILGKIPREEYKHAAVYWGSKTRGNRSLTPNRLSHFINLARSKELLLQLLAEGPVFIDKILSVEDIGVRELYEKEVPETHTYISNGIISHNSITGAAVQRRLNKNVVYLCTTKQLQEQLLKDFPYARTLYGRNNYHCLLFYKMFPVINAEHCVDSEKTPCRQKNKCPYMIEKIKALSAPLAILNTSYFLHEVNYAKNKYPKSFSGVPYLIIDECDTVENQLMSFVEFTITNKQLERLNVPPPRFKTKFESWLEWGNPTLITLQRELDKLEEVIGQIGEDSWNTVSFNDLRRAKELDRLISKLSFFVKNVDMNWVWYPEIDKWAFKPVWVSRFSEYALWRHAGKILGMSATILDPVQFDRNVGLSMHKRGADYLALPSLFPKENRPIYFQPSANMTFKTMDVELPKLVVAIDRILDKYPNDKGLVHTVSYHVKEYLVQNLRNKKRLTTHNTKDRAEKLAEFKKSTEPLVMVSPSMDRGIDLPQEECRFIIIAKIPFPSLGDPQIKKRVYASQDGDRWYAYHTISTIIQSSGRGVRSKTDFADTYILDEQFQRLYEKNRDLFPGWFKEALIA